jgi:anti-sigma factor RsiW
MTGEFDHRLDAQFAQLRDITATSRPDLADDFDRYLPAQYQRAHMTAERLRRLLAVAALVCAAIAFLSAVVASFSAPGWVGWLGLLLLCIAVVIP